MSYELKPCPFCGGEARVDGSSWRVSDGEDVAWVTCTECNAFGPTGSGRGGITAWNTRAKETPNDAT